MMVMKNTKHQKSLFLPYLTSIRSQMNSWKSVSCIRACSEHTQVIAFALGHSPLASIGSRFTLELKA
jgi:hypothetical protein